MALLHTSNQLIEDMIKVRPATLSRGDGHPIEMTPTTL
ncbi:MAG: hypothetical protein OJF50_003514 [Nitrospira sp.]|nr:hypothetical protein [Nitrospira sp.]